MDDAVRQLAADSGALAGLRGRRANGDGYAMLELAFPSGVLLLSCNSDTDEVIAAVTDARHDALSDVAQDQPFIGLVGKVIEYAWTMTNHRGYADAFQLRFLDPDSWEEVARQFEVAASALTVHQVH